MNYKLTTLQLKMIAVFLMLLEHTGRYLPGLFPEHFPLYFEYAGRIVAPIFFYLAVESFYKTSNRRRFILRLFAWGLFMLVGNMIVSQLVKSVFTPLDFYSCQQNIFLTIAIGISMIAAIDWARKQIGKRRIFGWTISVLLAVLILFTEASYNGLFMFIVFYFFYAKKSFPFAYIVLSIIFLLMGIKDLIINPEYFWNFDFQWMMIAALPLLLSYNGKQGKFKLKYFFYAIYPLHIWLLYILGNIFEWIK